MLAITIINLLFLKLFFCQNNDEVNYYVNLIKEANQNAEKFAFPTDAREYLPKNNKLTSFGSFDFIIVGGGATGSVIARRLSENSNVTVLVLEAGEFGNNLTSIPALGFPQLGLDRKWNWGFKSVPQKTACLGAKNQQCVHPRGKGMGGTSLLNGLINARGGSTDYNNWSEMGNPGWSYKEVLPLFKKIEHFEKNNPDAPVEPSYHGRYGFINIDYNRPTHPKVKVFLEAHQEIGSQLLDYNGKYTTGVSPVQVATKNGRRVDSASAYLKPVRHRHNLRIMTHSYVTKIMFCKKERVSATGVIFSHNEQLYSVRIKKELILSAGAIGSPHLLMTSGVGPKPHLISLNISVLKNLQVGTTLKEHPAFYGLIVNTNLTNPVSSTADQVKQFLNGLGTLTVPGSNYANSFISLGSENSLQTYADVEILLKISQFKKSRLVIQKSLQWTDQTYDSLLEDNFDDSQGMQIVIILLHEKSSGSLRLKSRNPFDYPLINPNMLSDKDNRDLQVMYQSIQLVQRLLKTQAYKKINATLHSKPHPACKQYTFLSREYWFCALKQETQTVHHPVGTCQMGPSAKQGAVVNHLLQVHGVSNLRVADASIFPVTLSGHPYLPCVMIGEFISNLLKKEYKLRR